MARFDAVADHYDAFCHTPLGAFVDRVERQLIDTLLAPQPGEQLVDLGCGTGAYSIALATLGCAVTGVDESREMLTRARAKSVTGGSVDFVQADLIALPWPRARFDAGLLQVTLEFVQDPRVVVREAWRVVRPGGRLVLGLIHGPGPWARYYRARAEHEPNSVYRAAHFWTLPELADLFGAPPTVVVGGLYLGPEEFVSDPQAWAWEQERRNTWSLDHAGFLAVRYDRNDLSLSQEGPKR